MLYVLGDRQWCPQRRCHFAPLRDPTCWNLHCFPSFSESITKIYKNCQTPQSQSQLLMGPDTPQPLFHTVSYWWDIWRNLERIKSGASGKSGGGKGGHSPMHDMYDALLPCRPQSYAAMRKKEPPEWIDWIICLDRLCSDVVATAGAIRAKDGKTEEECWAPPGRTGFFGSKQMLTFLIRFDMIWSTWNIQERQHKY